MPALDGPGLILVFAAAGIATWIAGLYLSRATDALDVRLGLGEALGGMILLAVAGSLPELAITVSAVAEGELGIAAGNLIGGIAMQTLVLVICDRVVRGEHPLSYLVGSLIPVLEGLLVVVVVGVMLMGTMLPSTTAVGPFSPASIGIVVAWVVGFSSSIASGPQSRGRWRCPAASLAGATSASRTRSLPSRSPAPARRG